jgi:hypothetical protein
MGASANTCMGRENTMIRIFLAVALATGLAGCVVAPPYAYAPAPGYGYGYYAAPSVNVGIGYSGGWHR